jgi:hypothetical protein
MCNVHICTCSRSIVSLNLKHAETVHSAVHSAAVHRAAVAMTDLPRLQPLQVCAGLISIVQMIYH